MELARKAAQGRQGRQPAEHGHRRQRADRVEEVHALLRRRAAHRASAARKLPPDRRPPREVRRREHDLRGGHRRSDLHRRRRRFPGDPRLARRLREENGDQHPDAHRWRLGRLRQPLPYPDYTWDFRLPRVQSINASGHKFGLVPPGLGWVVFRERKFFNEELVFYVNYLGGEMPTATLNFSRGTAPIAVQ